MTTDDDWGKGLDDRIGDYLAAQQNDKNLRAGTVGLPAVLAALGADIRAAQAQAAKDGHETLVLKDASVELSVVVTYDVEADAKVKFWVFTEAALDAKVERARTVTIKLDLSPAKGTGSIPLGVARHE